MIDDYATMHIHTHRTGARNLSRDELNHKATAKGLDGQLVELEHDVHRDYYVIPHGSLRDFRRWASTLHSQTRIVGSAGRYSVEQVS